ncbi:MAG: carbamoyltransferase HypF, partial [Ignavibacteriales bacterium]|nr:carbamoyltransferase HypF [Ignavibacteriales bacterium]
PRFSIIESLPYDRAHTSMKHFAMCPECMCEYENPLDRRFHAQPNACPVCGPQLELWDTKGDILSAKHDALLETAQWLREGKVVAVKGLGGFHLMVDAQNEEAIKRLRERKHREEKPFALMYPSLESIKKNCEVSEFEERLLLSPESPIVLLKRRTSNFRIASQVAPRNPYYGIMLPYTPLHHILMQELGFPVVATSGNLSDEPICTDERDALMRLNNIADAFLVHNRPIVRHVDDSIVRVTLGRELILRRARGYAPLPITISMPQELRALAVGAHLKNTVAMTLGDNVFMSQHIGDLETAESLNAFHAVINDFQKLYDVQPREIVCDMHPDYLSTKAAKNVLGNVTEIQHHYAHVASCMAENQLEGEVLGVSWDGTGYGLDGKIWGGEFLLTTQQSFRRVATLRQFRLPGGEKAIKEPRRVALGLLYEIFGADLFGRNDIAPLQSFSDTDLDIIRQMLAKGLNAPFTSSVGRLFDAVASLVGLRQILNFEGQAAMEMEFLTASYETEESYEFQLSNGHAHRANGQKMPISSFNLPILIDWSPMINELLSDLKKNNSPSIIAAKFHNTLTDIIVRVAKIIGRQRIVLTGGCFQNTYLTERTVAQLDKEGFRPYWHQRVPPNDGGLSLGQIYALIRLKSKAISTIPTHTVSEGVLQ